MTTLYKKNYPNKVGQMIRLKYEQGHITDLKGFEEALYESISCCKE